MKRDDITSPVYGGNKVRTLEVLFGLARQRGATHIYSTGAFGSNHAVATVLHAPRVDLVPGVCLFPQPFSAAALENARVTSARCHRFVALPHWLAFPFGVWRTKRLAIGDGERPVIMPPGGATPEGAMGYVAAAFELATQVAEGQVPRPRSVLIGVGSTCTTAGLLLGFALAAARGIGFVEGGRPAIPKLVSVRVTPWPVTSRFQILRLAARTSQLLARLSDDGSVLRTRGELSPRLEVDGRYLGRGYGQATHDGRAAIDLFREIGGPKLDTTYSGKSAASLLDRIRRGDEGPLLYWATKSTVPLPEISDERIEHAPARARRWIARAEAKLAAG